MASKVETRRAELKQRLTEAAEAKIVKGGVASVKARDLAAEAGCAVGAIYNVFQDMNALIMEVNGRTFHKLGASVVASLQGRESEPPTERLIAMSCAYLDFAARNTGLWNALFDLEMTTDGQVPEWYLKELQVLFSHIARPVSELFPEMSHQELELMTRALFSSVHGIVLLGLQNRISGVPRDRIETMIAQILRKIGNK
jgi:AcrR family transcriptional regulator